MIEEIQQFFSDYPTITILLVSTIKALITLIVGFWLIKRITKILVKALSKTQDETLAKFLKNIINIVLKALLLVSVAQMVGVETTSFVAILGAAGLAVGLALQGSLSNFAGGVLIILFKPFKIGDLVELEGHMGTVKEIQIFNTIITTADSKTIILPNGTLANSNIINYYTEPLKRVDFVFGISYESDIQKAKEVIRNVVDKQEKILQDKEKTIAVHNLGDSSVDITARIWTKSEHYLDMYFTLYEEVKVALDNAGISIPYPHREVYVHNVN